LLINFIYGWRCAKQNELANLVIRLLLAGMGTTQLRDRERDRNRNRDTRHMVVEGSCYWIL